MVGVQADLQSLISAIATQVIAAGPKKLSKHTICRLPATFWRDQSNHEVILATPRYEFKINVRILNATVTMDPA